MKKRIAVVVPNWNGEEYLDQCLVALKNQTIEHTVFVVDNGSIDNSKEIIENSGVTGIYLDKNYGFAGGVNRGIERAMEDGFEYVFLLNNDAKAAPDAIEKLYEAIKKDKKIGIATCKFLTYDGKKLDSTGDFYSTWGLPFPRGRGSTDTKAYDHLTDIFGGTGGASLYRISLFEDIGLFDEDFFAYFEDVDISFRAQLRGWKAKYVPDAKIYHHIGGTSRKLKGFPTYNSFKNLPWLLIKNVPKELMWTIGPRFMMARMIFFASAVFRGEIVYAIRGDWAATIGLYKKWKQRKEIQSRAVVSADDIATKLYGGIPPNYLRLRSIRDKFKGKKTEEDEPTTKPVIAIDLRCLDGASRFRGIGQYLHNLLSLLLPELKKDYTIILYAFNPESLSGINKDALEYCEIVEVPRPFSSKIPTKIWERIKGFYPRSFKADHLPRIGEVDLFLQTYVDDGLPTKMKVKTITIAYDLIPLLFAEHYFSSGGLGRRPRALIIKASRALDKRNYIRSLQGYGESTEVVAISKHTKKTLVEELDVNPSKIAVSYPGVPPSNKAKNDGFEPPKDPYIVYIGGIDYRRDLVTLIESFELLRAKEKNFKLVLAGRDFDNIHDKRLSDKLKATKYKDDIIIHGFISEYAKHTLMRNAVALVYPTLYEGFGIPVVEAFQDSCPVITYRNSSVVEAGGDAAIYAETPKAIVQSIDKLQSDKNYRDKVVAQGIEHAKKFTWLQASKDYHKVINEVIKRA